MKAKRIFLSVLFYLFSAAALVMRIVEVALFIDGNGFFTSIAPVSRALTLMLIAVFIASIIVAAVFSKASADSGLSGFYLKFTASARSAVFYLCGVSFCVAAMFGIMSGISHIYDIFGVFAGVVIMYAGLSSRIRRNRFTFGILSAVPALWLLIRLVILFTSSPPLLTRSGRVYETLLLLSACIFAFYAAKAGSGSDSRFSSAMLISSGISLIYITVVYSLPAALAAISAEDVSGIIMPVMHLSSLPLEIMLLCGKMFPLAQEKEAR